MNKARVGLVGYSKMGKAHSFAYTNVSKFFNTSVEPDLQMICGRNQEQLIRMAGRFGWKHVTQEWREMIARDDVDLVDICTPNELHDVIALEAAKRGKHIFCEKPLAINRERAARVTEAVLQAEQDHGIRHMVCFNYRFVPAVVQAKKMIERGQIGIIHQFRGRFLQDWLVSPKSPATWRLDKNTAGSGALGDLGTHAIDLALFLVGEIGEVTGLEKTFIAERPVPGSDRMQKVTVDDATVALLQFASGAIGTLEASRFASGHKCTNEFEISGSKGSLRFNLQNFNELEYFSFEDDEDVQGFRKITVTRPNVHPYGEAWWGPGHVLGFENTFVHILKEMLDAIGEKRRPIPNFIDGLRCQEVLDAIEDSVRQRKWQEVKTDFNLA